MMVVRKSRVHVMSHVPQNMLGAGVVYVRRRCWTSGLRTVKTITDIIKVVERMLLLLQQSVRVETAVLDIGRKRRKRNKLGRLVGGSTTKVS
jgi:hypothetical protein